VHGADGNAEALAAADGFQIFLGINPQPGENGWQVRRDVTAFVFAYGATAPVDELQVVREGEGEVVGGPQAFRFLERQQRQRVGCVLVTVECLYPVSDAAFPSR
jgi:hypothetical protein